MKNKFYLEDEIHMQIEVDENEIFHALDELFESHFPENEEEPEIKKRCEECNGEIWEDFFMIGDTPAYCEFCNSCKKAWPKKND
jgi:hypothetical protein